MDNLCLLAQNRAPRAFFERFRGIGVGEEVRKVGILCLFDLHRRSEEVKLFCFLFIFFN